MDSFGRFRDKVVQPAVELVIMIQTSRSIYRFTLPKVYFQKSRPISVRDLYGNYKYVDIETLKTVKPSSKVVADKKGFIGDIALPVEPVLQRQNRGAKSTLLCQGTYLISLDAPLKTGTTS